MIKKDLRRMVLPLALMICLSVLPFMATPTQAVNPIPFFTISILAPNTNDARNQWSTLMVEQLPKIGIGIDVFDHTGWAQITPRTWSYPGPYPIPTYAEGGFDIFFVGWSWGLDWDPTGLFDSPSITPNGDNFYQYVSQDMDWAISNYTSSFVLQDRIDWCQEIQALLYEDLPQTTIIYPLSLYPHATDFEGWDGLLWASSYQNMENWSVGTQTEFHYACPADFVDFHPYTYESVYDAQWIEQIYDGMYERDALNNRAYSPRIADSISSADGLTYNIELDPLAVFADDHPLTAYDVEFSYNLLISEDFANPSLAYWQLYLDASSVNVIDDNSLTITFLREYVFQDGNLAVDILPEHIWSPIAEDAMEAQAINWATTDPNKLMGSGPYYLEEYDGTNGVIHLTLNTYFSGWTGITPNFDDIYLEFYSNKEGALSDLAAGTIDMVDAQFVPQISEVPAGSTYTLVEDPGTQELAFNCLHPYLGTGELCPISSPESGKNIRKAISTMIPRTTIVEEIMNGLAVEGSTGCPNVAIGYDDTIGFYPYSIDLAQQYMEAAGFVYVFPTSTTGLGLYVVIGILALAGASQVFFLKRRK
ncbi:MAG TPA: ABC transporter substrate-binding protein [Candidatus Bathyarchaeia archaeon]|nr:ABC transporter substrate-binding protein [Candidatus Bathyarchaeia archaeon]